MTKIDRRWRGLRGKPCACTNGDPVTNGEVRAPEITRGACGALEGDRTGAGRGDAVAGAEERGTLTRAAGCAAAGGAACAVACCGGSPEAEKEAALDGAGLEVRAGSLQSSPPTP